MRSDTARGGLAEVVLRCLSSIDRQWPSVKYCSLGFYSAWILLVMSGTSIVVTPVDLLHGQANSLLYLYSGVPLTLILVFCGVFYKHVEPHILRGPLVPCMSLLASVCTFIAAGGLGFSIGHVWFLVASVGTGIGTPFLCLRIGAMYSTLDSTRVFFTTFASGLLANLLYFMCVAVDQTLSLVLLSSFPLLAAFLALLKQVNPPAPDESDVVPLSMLPKGFLARCVLFVGVFAIAVGTTKGLATTTIEGQQLSSQIVVSVFASFMVAAVLIVFAAIANGVRKFELAKLFYPIIVVTALACLLSPLLGVQFLWLQTIIMNVAYNIFTLGLWCLFSNIAGQTDASSVRVFGLGRGASAFGTTFGQFIAVLMVDIHAGAGSYTLPVGVAFAVLVLILTMSVFDERTIKDALDKTFRGASEGEEAALSQGKLWNRACEEIGAQHHLTARELEILKLLGRGRTASYISEELSISYNTTKGHIRNLYAKCDVHSRQELIDLIEVRCG